MTGHEHAEDWHQEIACEVDGQVHWASIKERIPPSDVCHADAKDDVANDGDEDIHECELWGECNEGFC